MLEEWRAFARLEPFGDQRADLRVGQLTALVANAMREKGTKPYSWADFSVEGSKTRRATGDEQMLLYVKNLHVMFTALWEKKNGKKQVTILALSAHAMKERIDQSFAAGMNGHIAKPVSLADLQKALQAI